MVDRAAKWAAACVGCLWVAAAGTEPPTVETTLVEVALVSPAGALPSGLRWEVVAVPLAGGQSVAASAELPEPAQLALPASESFELKATSPGYWAPSLEVRVQGPSQRFEVSVFPAGTLKGTLDLPGPQADASSLEVRIQPAPGRLPTGWVPTTTLTCPVEKLAFTCPAPAGRLDLRLKAPARVPVYLWSRDLQAGGSLDLGKVRLEPGASISGWARLDGGAPASGATIRARSWLADLAPTSVEEDRRVGALERTTKSNDRGFFQIDGLQPGAYELAAERGDLVPARRGPIEVRDGLESQLIGDLVLAEPAELTVLVTPGVDPLGRPWHIELSPPGPGRIGKVLKRRTNPSGEATFERIHPGELRLLLQDAEGERWLMKSLTVRPGRGLELIDLPLIEVRGTVRLGDEPLATRVAFARHDGRQVRFLSDEEGRFEGSLPEPGKWLVGVELEGGRQAVPVGPVEVRKAEGKSWAEVEIVLPDTRVAGLVVDEDGRPVAGAKVLATLFGGTKQGASGQTETASDGRFEWIGLVEGTYQVSARSGEESSESVPALVDEELDPPELRLELRANRTVEVRVHGTFGPIAGARVVAMADAATGGTVVDGITGLDGSTRLALPARAPSVTLVAAAPGWALRFQHAALVPGEAIEIRLDRTGGELEVDLSAGSGENRGLLANSLLFNEQGAAVPALFLLQVSGAHRDSLSAARARLPLVTPGTYSLCWGREAVRAYFERRPAPGGDSCRTGYLGAFGRLTLSLPAPASG